MSDDIRECDALELKRLRQRVEELEGALRPFAEAADVPQMMAFPDSDGLWFSPRAKFVRLTIGDLRRARAALRRDGGE